MNDLIQKSIEQLPEILRNKISSQWLDFVEAGGHEGLSDVTLEQLVIVWAASPQSAQYCLRYPCLLREWQLGDGSLPALSIDSYKDDCQRLVSDLTDEAQIKKVLRDFRNQEMLRIAWRDIAGLDELNNTLQALSTLAESMLQVALEWLTARHVEKYGHARTSGGDIQNLVVIGMGKLGGRELNFSSDIDLIFAYQEAGETDGTRSLSNEDYFRRLIQDLVSVLNEPTADGFVFRVDTRLRPFGSSGPLAMHFAALEQYYQVHGREWERYAWIKARPVAGDLAAGNTLLKLLQPFIYRRYLDYGAFDAMREMKDLIEQQIKRKRLSHNIKLGAGGIREIEFIVQVFQLIHGGRHPELRSRQLRKVLPALAELGFISDDSVQQLDAAYVFLRKLENRLQAYADQQTHVLPEKDTGHAAIALAMGFPGWHQTVAAIDAHRLHVHDQFDRVFAAPQTRTCDGDPQTELMALWQETLPEETAEALLQDEGFSEPDSILELLSKFRDGIRYRADGEQSHRRLNRCVIMLIAAASGTENPDIVLERLLRVLRAIAGRSNYVALLVENPMALSQLVRLCAASPWITEQIVQSPMLLDSLLDARQLYSPPLKHALQEELQSFVSQAAENDIEQKMNLLRRFKQTSVLRVAAADVSDVMPLMVVSDRLTDIAEVVVEHALKEAWAQTIDRHGQPLLPNGNVAGFLVIAYGKFGGIELGYSSDLDLVFVHDGQSECLSDGQRPVSHEAFFTRLGQRIIHWLNTYTPAGRAYEVDMRLRPSGQSGLLVTSFDALENYQHEKAWVWEHQALVRARAICGSSVLKDRFNRLRHQILVKPRDEQTLRRDVIEMREKMRTALEKKIPRQFDLKQGVGGIADIEFIVQYNALRWASKYPKLIQYSDNIRILEALGSNKIWTVEQTETISEVYRKYRSHKHRLALQELPAHIPDELYIDEREQVALCWKRELNISTEK